MWFDYHKSRTFSSKLSSCVFPPNFCTSSMHIPTFPEFLSVFLSWFPSHIATLSPFHPALSHLTLFTVYFLIFSNIFGFSTYLQTEYLFFSPLKNVHNSQSFSSRHLLYLFLILLPIPSPASYSTKVILIKIDLCSCSVSSPFLLILQATKHLPLVVGLIL